MVADPPDQQALDFIAQLEQLDALLTDPAYLNLSNVALMTEVGIADIVRPADYAGSAVLTSPRPASAVPVEIAEMNMRLALTPLSQAFGAEDNFVVMAAQKGAGQTDAALPAIAIRAGDATLSDIRQFTGDTGTGSVTLTRPLVILDGASLTLGPGEELLLSRPDGAFVVNFGHLAMRGATIAAVGGPNVAANSFYPFVTSTDAGSVDLQNARFVGLGFGQTLKFSGFSILRSILIAPERPSLIDATTFSGLVTVGISGDTDVVLQGNRFHDMRGPALTVSRTLGARILANVFFGTMPTNAIRLQDGSARGLILGNVILGGERAGIFVRGDSIHATVARNIVWGRDGGGITLQGSECGRIMDNLVIQNDQKGIEVRDSIGAELLRNTVFSNHSAGIWISAQPEGAETRLTGNIISFNGAGLAGADTEMIVMDGNDFSKQYQQFLSGDLAPLTAAVAVHMRGQSPFVLASGMQPGTVDTLTEAAPTVCSN